jgi:hypothetical protein
MRILIEVRREVRKQDAKTISSIVPRTINGDLAKRKPAGENPIAAAIVQSITKKVLMLDCKWCCRDSIIILI